MQRDWEQTYRETPLEELPWEEGRPAAELVALVESGTVDRGPVLDICINTLDFQNLCSIKYCDSSNQHCN